MASGDRTESRLGGPTQLGTTTTTICTAGTGITEVIKQIIICNTDTVDRTVTLAVGSAATAANRILSALPIGANDVIILDTALVLLTTETLQGLSDTASKVNVTVVGWEKTN
jgi:2-phospho-L-lactate guanylyltransferase (CobY/MobA/RfbA family)